MKRAVATSIIAATIISPLLAKEYAIQLSTLGEDNRMTPLLENELKKAGVQHYYVNKAPNNLYRVCIGEYSDYAIAKKRLAQFKTTLFSDAYITVCQKTDNSHVYALEEKQTYNDEPTVDGAQEPYKEETATATTAVVVTQQEPETITHAAPAHQDVPEVKEAVAEQPQQPLSKHENYLLFADIELGAAYIKNSLDGTVTLDQTPNTVGTALSVGVGINWNEHMFSTLNYQAGFMDMIDLNNLYATFNGKHTMGSTTPYIGLLMGYSNLHWNKNPITYTSRSVDSNSFLIGFQAGVEIALLQRLSVLLNYKYEGVFHKTNLSQQDNSGTIDSNGFQNFNAGLRVYFY